MIPFFTRSPYDYWDRKMFHADSAECFTQISQIFEP